MKSLSVVTMELREQVEEATDPKDPSKLIQYTKSLRDNIAEILPLLEDDPTMAALAFHNQIQFDDQSILAEVAAREMVSGEDWDAVKKTIKMRESAHEAVRIIEMGKLEAVLVAAVAANFRLTLRRRALREASEEELQHAN